MVDVFLLLVYLGTGPERKLESGNMMFWSIERCNYFAKSLSHRYGTYGSIDPRDKATAYCVPRQVDPKTVEIYE